MLIEKVVTPGEMRILHRDRVCFLINYACWQTHVDTFLFRFSFKVRSQLHTGFGACLLEIKCLLLGSAIKGFPLCYFTLLLIMDTPHLVATHHSALSMAETLIQH